MRNTGFLTGLGEIYVRGILQCLVAHGISDQRTANFFMRCPPSKFESYIVHKKANLLNAGGPLP
jgi:hypothetical protein